MNDFLMALFPWGCGYVELRMIRDGKVEQRFFEWGAYGPDDVEDASYLMDEAGWDCYFGVMPRIVESGTAADCATETSVLWADLDIKNLGGTHIAALLSVQKADLAPSIIVDSGNGLHCYWLLRQPVPFDRASAAMKGLAQLIGGDSVHDAPRVLRLPGTRNHKTDPPRPVRLLTFNPQMRFRFSDFEEYIAPARLPRAHRDFERQSYEDLPDYLRELIEEGVPRGQRSEAIWKVVCQLIERGWEEAEITDLFMSKPDGIGAKVAEAGERQAERYMQRTIRRANEVVL